MAHIGFDHIKSEVGDHLAQICHALFVGGNLGLQVGDVLGDVAHRVGVVGEQFDQFGFTEAAAFDDAEIVDQHAFLVHCGGQRRHRAGRGSADIGVVAARGRPEQDLAAVI